MIEARSSQHSVGQGVASNPEEPRDRPAIFVGRQRFRESIVAFTSLCFGPLCLFQWRDSLELKDLMDLRGDVQRVKQARSAPVVLILSISDSVGFPPGSLANAMGQSLPGILSDCSNFLVAIEGEDAHRRLFRALFSGGQRSSAALAVEFHDSLDAALVSARRIAPHDAIQLQRLVRTRRGGSS